MATTYKNSQIQGTAGLSTYATLYNTGASTTAVISTILVTNTTNAPVQYRMAIMGTAGTPANPNFIVYDDTIAANDVVALTLGVVLGNSQFIRVSSSADTIGFNAFISEIS
jgi:hypothetical protein